jgi:hypothetical protein
MTTSSPGPASSPGSPSPWENEPGLRLTPAEQARQDEEMSAYLAATANDQPPREDAELWTDPETGPPLDADTWLGQIDQEESQEEPVKRAADSPRVESWADVSEHDGTGPGGPGFESGSELDRLEPGPVLVAALEDAWADGLDRLSDDALAGVMLAFRRCESLAAAGLWDATAELARRREAAGPRVAEHTDQEVGMLLAWSRPATRRLLGTAVSLVNLPATRAALRAGKIDRLKAEIIAYETDLLDPALAAAVELLVIEGAPTLTGSQLRARLRRAVIAADPTAARRRAAQAALGARVEIRAEQSGATAALSGRDLPVQGALAADQRIDAAARSLKAAGAVATLPQLRAAVFLSLLTGSDPGDFLPAGQVIAPDSKPGDSDAVPGPVTLRGSVNLTMPLASWLGQGFSPGDIAGFGPVTAGTCQEVADWIAVNPGSRWCVTLTGKDGRAAGHGCARRPPPARGDPARLAAWLARLKIEPVQAGACTHARQAAGYRIPARLHHLVSIRQRTCVNPVCTRPAIKCDGDHTLPYDQGGKTCECNIGPACRCDHRTKQAPGWRLEQPTPGVFVWHLPSGRTITTGPDPYPI